MDKKKITETADNRCLTDTEASGSIPVSDPDREISEKTEDKGKNNDRNRDISSKTVFRDRVLCAQFFQDNFDIPALKNVRPEDIEDISERFLPYLGTEFDSDTVKKIRILDISRKTESGTETENRPPFLVSLIDHKSVIDYDAAMQLLRYMMCIWTEYRREMEAKSPGCTSRKKFRYPVILPIIYYEGKSGWTADRCLSGRIADSAEYGNWIPDFRYEVVRIHDYSNDDLLKRGNEMSLVMLINKIQDASDLEKFIHISPQELNSIVRNSPRHVLDRVVEVMENLCFKINTSDEERIQCVRKVRDREMGYLFENMEHIDIQEERRKRKEERQKAEEERRKAEEERQRAEEERRRADRECQRANSAEEKLRFAEETIRQLRKGNV